MEYRLAIVFLLWCVLGCQVWAATVLFDFESDDDIRLWHDERKAALGPDKKLERVERFAASGRCSMRFFTPAWRPAEHGGQQKWPAFEGKPPIADWSKYDRLAMEVVNVTDSPQRLMLFISDSKTPTRKGLVHRVRLSPQSREGVVINLRQGFANQKVDSRDIHVMHFFTEDPPTDMVIHLDRLLLLAPGEQPPPLPTSYLKELATLQSGAVEAARQSLVQIGDKMKQTAAGKPHLAAWVSEAMAGLQARLADLEARRARGDESVLAAPQELARLKAQAASMESLLTLRLNFAAVRPATARDDVVVAFATSMEKVLPRAVSPTLTPKTRVEVRLARNEKESFQVVVIPVSQDIRQVQVRVSDLRTADGKVLSANNVDAVAVGYVQTKAEPPYGTPHMGWWPDPILNFLTTVDIAKGDAQAFWVRVRAPKSQAPGTYHGKLDVLVQGATAFSAELAVRVYGFEMPDVSPLPLAITFAPHDHPLPETQKDQAEWRKAADYPINAWKKHKAKWADMLADYYLTYDSLYHRAVPDFEILSRLHEQGRLGRFNLGYFDPAGDTPEAFEKWKSATLPRLREGYEHAKRLGILDHAYIYGCDEKPAETFPQVQRAAAALKAEFFDVLVMTTTCDHSYGMDTVIKSMDAWCPLTPKFDSEKAAKSRAQGRQVWWYICAGPHHPHANMFIEFPAIEGRLLMGAMTAKYRPDGFLYYQISIWNSRRPIESGPFTDWDPRSWTVYHGDGSWTCVGPDGTPLPTIRLENFRDGLEDYAYFRILEATVAKAEAAAELRERRADWLKAAKTLLQVPAELVTSLTAFTLDPAALYSYRDRLADAIESAGVEPAQPWGKRP